MESPIDVLNWKSVSSMEDKLHNVPNEHLSASMKTIIANKKRKKNKSLNIENLHNLNLLHYSIVHDTDDVFKLAVCTHNF